MEDRRSRGLGGPLGGPLAGPLGGPLGGPLEGTSATGKWKRTRPSEETMAELENPGTAALAPQPKRHSPYLPEGARVRQRLPGLSRHNAVCLPDSLPDLPAHHEPPCPENLPPTASWADPPNVWKLMVAKSEEQGYQRLPQSKIFGGRHPDLNQPRIRAILLDWIIDVCEVYKLHRETFYLAVDFVDRYLSETEGFLRSRLQLLGVTALFAAAKLEEIYPPKCEEFAYVTDQACTDTEIRHMELELMQVLKWQLAPVTPLQWLRLFLQLFHLPVPATSGQWAQTSSQSLPSPALPTPSLRHQAGLRRSLSQGSVAGLSAEATCLLKPQFQRETFLTTVKLLDAAVVQEESMGLSYAALAGAVLVCLMEEEPGRALERVRRRCGLRQRDLADAVHFLRPTVAVLERPGALPAPLAQQLQRSPRTPHWDDVPADDAHNVQTRDVSLALYDVVHARKAALLSHAPALLSPTQPPPPAYPTPPSSNERPHTPNTHLHDRTNLL